MKKQIPVLVAALLIGAAATARPMPAAKGTQVKQRLIAYSYRHVGGPMQDSVHASYSGYRGSDSLRSLTWIHPHLHYLHVYRQAR